MCVTARGGGETYIQIVQTFRKVIAYKFAFNFHIPRTKSHTFTYIKTQLHIT